MDSMRKLLAPYFSLKGRSSRREWWIIEILIVLGFRLNEHLFEIMAKEGGRFDLGAEAGQTWMTAAATLLWLNIASNVRRLHDRGKSGWWSLIYLIPGIGQLWCFIECGFLKGLPHANRYGPPTGTVGVYQSLADQLRTRLPTLGVAMPTPPQSPTPKAAARATRRISILAASQRPAVQRPAVQRPTVQRGTGGLPLPGGRTLRVAIAVIALLFGLATMALTTGVPIPTGVAPVGINPDVPVFRWGGQPAQP